MVTGMIASQALRTGTEQGGRPAAASSPSQASSPAMRKLEKAAQEFEGILMADVWRAWNKSDRMGNEHDPIGDSLAGMGLEMASMAMAEKGGIGIAQMIVNSLKKEVTGQPGN